MSQNEYIQPDTSPVAAKPQSANLEQPAVTPALQVPNDNRVRKKYRVPEKSRLHKDADPVWVGVQELSSNDMQAASAIAKKVSGTTLAFEMAKLGLFAVTSDPSGRSGWMKIDHASGQQDTLWEKYSVKVRMLITHGVQSLNSTSEDEDEAFLESAADF